MNRKLSPTERAKHDALNALPKALTRVYGHRGLAIDAGQRLAPQIGQLVEKHLDGPQPNPVGFLRAVQQLAQADKLARQAEAA